MPRTDHDAGLPASAAPAVALFVSDVHLQADAPRTAQAFFDFLEQARGIPQVYLLGDLFEYWAGDDDLASPFNASIVAVLRSLSNDGGALFWMPGNRDFLIGEAFARAAGLILLADPTVVMIAGRRIVMAHGDLQCTDDVAYQTFRTQVRSQVWQQEFLAQPLEQRLAVIGKMREGSRIAQRSKSLEIMDVNPTAIEALFVASSADLMIHGHTHRPARHVHVIDGVDRKRHVLPDWDCETATRRGGGLAIDAAGTLHPVPLVRPGST